MTFLCAQFHDLFTTRFDYCGIAFLTVGSFVPWLYFSFYCDWKPQVIYLAIVIVLGIGAVVVSTFDFFAGPRFRPLRAGVFIFFGLSGIAPATHYGVVNGWEKSLEEAALGWLILMGILYITGALLYAGRIPERFFPGKVDIWVIIKLPSLAFENLKSYHFSFSFTATKSSTAL